ncbi:MAG: hypothetical protein KJT03_23250, partial [Verrucomicrobiae bacterium]|nr:hypothetical protein [Verrucomicrobiae bacterium]
VVAGREAIRLTVEDCAFLEPVARQGFGRRHGFLTAGQQIFMQRCYAENATFPFVSLERSCGPNVFLDCYANGEKNQIGPVRYWSTGTLWDNVYGERLLIRNRGYEGGGWGWSGINQMFWNCTAFEWISVQSPVSGWNWAIGCEGNRVGAPFSGLNEFFDNTRANHYPQSLYVQQLADRVGKAKASGVFGDSQISGTVLIQLRDTLSR